MFRYLTSNTVKVTRLVFAATLIICSLAISGCTSSSTSNTASYGGPSVSAVSSKRVTAKSAVRKAKQELRAAQKSYSALLRANKNDKRLLKRKKLSSKEKKKIAKQLKRNKRNLRKSKRSLAKAEHKVKRAQKSEKRAISEVKKAKQRRIDAERKLAKEAKKKAAEKRRLAKEAKENKLKEQQLARQEAGGKKTGSFLTGSLFAKNDPALKNVRDYGARIDGEFPVAAIPVDKLDKRLYRQEVKYRSPHKRGTLVVDTKSKFLYLVQSSGRAMRYGIGVGKSGFEWSGAAHIGWKQEWPKWTPPDEMIERRPELRKYSADNGGMPGGPENPLGARALYLMQGNVDTLFRLHGTPQWSSIGTAASSGCIRLINQDIIDLYNRVPRGAKVVVL